MKGAGTLSTTENEEDELEFFKDEKEDEVESSQENEKNELEFLEENEKDIQDIIKDDEEDVTKENDETIISSLSLEVTHVTFLYLTDGDT